MADGPTDWLTALGYLPTPQLADPDDNTTAEDQELLAA